MQKLNSKYKCRKAKDTDDIDAIAKYIHLTDQYIYPFICEDPCDDNWKQLILQCTKMKNNIFNLDYISVVLCDEKIVGVACVIPCGRRKVFLEEQDVPSDLQEHMDVVKKGYFEPLIKESMQYEGYNITNICIDQNHWGHGVGSLLMEHCILLYGESPIHLDVIADNTAAVRLYEKYGFIKEETYYGFSGSDKRLSCHHMLRMPQKD